MKRIRILLCLIAVCAIGGAQLSYGQNVTAGSITGVVRDAQGGVLPGVTITATHTPTGTPYEAVTEADGSFTLLNVRVGGPYDVTAALASFRTQTVTGVQVNLGQAANLEMTLQLETISETVTVTAEASSLFTPTNIGTSANIQREVIENLPTVQRSIQDFARVNPFFAPTTTNANSGSALSVAGRSGRYNNLQIDGAVNNDLFGLADSALPGGQANTEPISLDAIQELQLVVAPYDVRQGNFSGGGINAITRSGSNSFTGSAYYLFRNQDWVGDGPDSRPIATFSDKTGGGRIGGPIVPNRAFFFANAEAQRRQTPSGWSINSTGQNFCTTPTCIAGTDRVLAIARSRYGYDPGGVEEFIRENPNEKLFLRGDVNVASNHQLIVRHNFIDSFNDTGVTQLNTRFFFPDQFYEFNSRANSTVGQLNSTFGKIVNEGRFTYQRVRDFRANRADPFPQVNVILETGKDLRFGTEQFSARNELDQDIIELHNDLTLVAGQHQFTFGTHNEFFKFRNLFIRDNFGYYQFNSIDLFEQGLAQSYDHSFSATSDPLQSARFWVYQLGFYAGDLWRVRDNVTVNYGVRLDMPIFPDTPNSNATVQSLYGINTNVTPESMTWSPRVGVHWDLSADETRQQVRGGIGIFGGRTPYVWLSNQYTSTGNEFTRISTGLNAANRIPFVADANAQPRNVGAAATNEINAIDPDYNFPQLIRGNLGYDRSLIGGLVATVDLVFSTTMQDINYTNLNMRQTSTRPDGRPFYSRAFPAFSDVIFLTNTDEGSAWQLATKLEKPFRNGWYASGSYLFGRSRTVNDGGSSQARSNWINNFFGAFDINDVPLEVSNFDPAHRITASAAYELPIGPTRTTFSVYYNGQTGRPYAYRFNNDVNGDQGTTNDLLYIPRDASDVIVTGGTFDQLMAFINDGNCSDLTPGTVMERNSCRGPWVNSLDFRAAVEVPVGRYSGEVTFDVLNLINLFNSENGIVEFASFNGLPVANGAVDAATGRWVYTLNPIVASPATNPRFSRDDLRSRWQAQLGFRFKF
jgi:hypothetical protein